MRRRQADNQIPPWRRQFAITTAYYSTPNEGLVLGAYAAVIQVPSSIQVGGVAERNLIAGRSLGKFRRCDHTSAMVEAESPGLRRPRFNARGRRTIRVNRLKFYILAIVLCQSECMSDEYTSTLQVIPSDRCSWPWDGGAHYRELAAWFRGVAARCCLPNPQRELLSLAKRYERRADHF
jgi:hypothetical protein